MPSLRLVRLPNRYPAGTRCLPALSSVLRLDSRALLAPRIAAIDGGPALRTPQGLPFLDQRRTGTNHDYLGAIELIA